MTTAQFISTLKPSEYIGEFKNQYGEAYVIFRLDTKELEGSIFIAGDETEWEPYILHPEATFAFKDFKFSPEETSQIKEILVDIKKPLASN